MDQTKTVDALCGVIDRMTGIIRQQAALLAQHGAAALEDEICRAQNDYAAAIGEQAESVV